MMRVISRSALAAIVVLTITLSPTVVSSQDSGSAVVVVNSRNPTRSLSEGEVQSIFLGQRLFWHGTVPITIFSRPGSSEAGGTLLTLVPTSSS